MSVDKTCNFNGIVAKDEGQANVSVGDRVRADTLGVCDLIEADTTVAGTVTVNNLQITQNTGICTSKSTQLDAVGCIETALFLGNTVFVTPSGDDTTGMRERIDCPFATPWAAVDFSNNNPNAAQAGDTVYIFPGTYNHFGADNAANRIRLVKNGIRVFALPGVNIQFNSAGSTVPEPFWDTGIPMVSEFRGYARVRVNNSSEQRTVTAPGSRLIVELDQFLSRTRLRVSGNAALFHFKARLHQTGFGQFHGQFLAVRHTSTTSLDIQYHVDQATAPVFNTAWTPYEFQATGGVSANDPGWRVDFWVGRLNFSGTSRVGVVDLQRPAGQKRVHIDNIEQYGNNGVLLDFARPLVWINGSRGHYDVRIRGVNHQNLLGYQGNPLICGQATTGPLAPSTGRIEIEGRFLMNAYNQPGNNSVDPRNLLRFATGSQLTYDIQAQGRPGNSPVTGFVVNRAFVDGTNCPDTVYVTGRLNYVNLIDPATLGRNAVRIDASGATGCSLRDFTVTTDNPIGPITSGAGAGFPLHMMNVFSNLIFDGASYVDAFAGAGGTIGTFANDPAVTT